MNETRKVPFEVSTRFRSKIAPNWGKKLRFHPGNSGKIYRDGESVKVGRILTSAEGAEIAPTNLNPDVVEWIHTDEAGETRHLDGVPVKPVFATGEILARIREEEKDSWG